jgi:hypothetical protein
MVWIVSCWLDGVVIGCRHHMFGWHELLKCWWQFPTFFCWHSKSWLSQHIAYTIAWVKVVGSCMVNKRSFTSPQTPNWNWFTNVTLFHEMSHASCLNLKVYTKVGRDPRQIIRNLFVVVCFWFKSPKEALNSSRNASKSFRRGDWCSKRNASYVKDVFDNKVPMSLTWV